MSISSDNNAGRFSARGSLQEKTTQKDNIVNFDMSDIRSNSERTDFPFCESDSINFFSSKWLIRVFPNGTNAENVGKVKVVLIGSSNGIVPMEVEYTLKTSKNVVVLKTNKCKLTQSSSLKAIDIGDAHTSYLISGDSMFRSTTDSNIFEIHLTLKTIFSNSSLIDCSSKSINTGFYFRDHLFHKATSDVDIVVEGTRIPAHKLILSVVSPVFTAMFENQMQESVSNEIVISDFSEEVVRSMLRCIYDCNAVVSEMEKHADQLLFMANKYQLTELEQSATMHISKNITVDNAIHVLLSADKFDRVQIKSAAMNFIVANADHFFALSDFSGRVGNVLTDEIFGYMIANKRVK